MEWWFKGFHHFYLGILMELLAFWLLANELFVLSLIIAILGLWLMIDDYWQHFIQSTKDKHYHSPLHRFYGWLYSRSGAIRWLNRIADIIFRKNKKNT